MVQDPICLMTVDEKTAFKLTSGGKDYFFCSKHCLEKFAKERNISIKESFICLISPKTPFYKNKIFTVSLVFAVLILSSYFISSLAAFRENFFIYFRTIWWAVILGLLLGGVIDYYVPREYISHILAKPKKRTIFYSVILGFFMSACSHGILALSIELHKKGASNPAVVAFLLASPWANITITIMLIGFFGFKGFFIVISAIIIAITTGLIFQILDKNGLIEKNKNIADVEEGFSVIEDIRKRIRLYKPSFNSVVTDIRGVCSGALSLANMVLWWILIGIGISSFAGAYIPSHIFHSYMGPTILGLFVTLIVATLIEVCSEGSSPMAFEIFRQTGALGNSFVFLMAGVVTDYTEIGLLWHNVGKRTAILLPIVSVPQVILLGIIANKIF
jgi:uncharacterized membrane protein YraQ (UPF0718 family)/YHS domain-containing protein